MKKFLAAVILMMSFINVSCAEPERDFSTGVNEFCWEYFATLDRKENIFYSPYGIHAALSILANGASGDTRQEILHALSAGNVENLNDGHKNFLAALEKNYGGENLFMESNLLLIDKKIFGRGLNKNFQNIVTDVYKSDVREANFSGNVEGEKKKISGWVSDKTRGFIPNYVSIVSSKTLTDLLNVVCFKGKWAMPFEVAGTSPRDFKNLDGSSATVDMLNKVFEDSITYHADEKFEAVELPYGAGAVMNLILPVDDKALKVAELWNDETYSYRKNFLDSLRNSSAFNGEVIVRLPKFEMDIENNLIENLKAIGIKKSFTDDAEFFYIINDTPLKIDNAKHRAKVKVDEQGTTAAAVTEITMIETGAAPGFEPPRRVYFIAERPFLFLIRDVESNVILFAGAVNKIKKIFPDSPKTIGN